MSTTTIHTALLDIAELGDDTIPLRDGLSLVRPNPKLLAHRWDWAQGASEMEQEEKETTRYLVCEYGEYVPVEQWRTAPERGENRFYAGLMAIQIVKPIRTFGFIYRHQRIDRRHPMQPGQWAMMHSFDNAMLARVPPLIDRVQAAFDAKNIVLNNAVTLLQLGLEHFHPYIAGMLWMMGLEAILDRKSVV